MSDRDRLRLPEEFAARVRLAGARVDALLPIDFAEAAEAAREELSLLELAEEGSGRDLHKGHPLYNIGLTQFGTKPSDALRHFEAAYVEDARTYENPVSRLAARALRALFQVPRQALVQLARRATLQPRANPFAIGDEVDLLIEPTYAPLFPETDSDDWLLETPPNDLVFVGGSYGGAGDRIYQIADRVTDCGLQPVVVGLLKRRPGESDREKSFRILDLCGLAVFEGSVQERPGWWAEVEHIVQTTRIPTLVAYYSSSGNPEYRTSAMFPTEADHPRLVVTPFGRNLDVVVRRWLTRVHPGPLSCQGPPHGRTVLLGSNTPYLPRRQPSGAAALPLPGSASPDFE